MDKVLFARLVKVDVPKRQVWGRATQEVPDKAKEVFDYESSAPLFRNWSAGFEKATAIFGEEGKSLGNIRAMHGKVAAGKVIAIEFNDAEKAIDIGTEITDDAEWAKVQKGTYTGFSIGGSYVNKWQDPADKALTRFTADPAEISIVDLPCVPTATFSMVKADGAAEDVPFAPATEPAEQAVEKVSPAEGSETGVTEPAPAEKTAPASEPAEAPAVVAARKALADAIAADEAEKAAAVEKAALDAKTALEAKAAPVVVKRRLLEKSMYSVGALADMLQAIAWMAQDAEWEKGWEQDSSTIPDELRTWLALGVEILKKMTAEETAELIAALTPDGAVVLDVGGVVEASAGGDVAKKGARHSKADMEKVQTLHDTAVSLGASCEAEKSAPAPMEKLTGEALSDLGKAVALATGTEPTTVAIEPEQITALAKYALTLAAEVEVLKRAPAEPKGQLQVVSKTDDTTDIGQATPAAVVPDPKDPKAVMKAVHASGGRRVFP